MTEDPKLIKLPTRADQKLVELNHTLQQIVNRLLQSSPEVQHILGQIVAWKEIEKASLEMDKE